MLQPVREHWQWDAMASYVAKLREAAVNARPRRSCWARSRTFNEAANSHLEAVELDGALAR